MNVFRIAMLLVLTVYMANISYHFGTIAVVGWVCSLIWAVAYWLLFEAYERGRR